MFQDGPDARMSIPQASRGKKHRVKKTWMREHVSDHWVHEAQRIGYRSRAAFKLLELAERDDLFRPGMTVVDLGAAPGSWCQVLRQRLGRTARIIAVDLLPMGPIAGVEFVQGDFRDESTLQALEKALDGCRVDLVLSDLSPNISGVASADQARSVMLGELALEFAGRWLQPGGDLVVKAFQGAGFEALRRDFGARFEKSWVRKPKASRDRSRELYLVGKGFVGFAHQDSRLRRGRGKESPPA
jgi:23S rRNA (uridine2552-2'-O)-methyltransferase